MTSYPLVALLALLIGWSDACSPECDICLGKADFENGTYRIHNPGQYCLDENIYFNPGAGKTSRPNTFPYWFPDDDDAFPGCLTQSDGAYALGFFAAITVESSNVVIDLEGYVLQMHWYFYLQQRFYSNIEIAPSPFLPGVGPAAFGTYWMNIDNVTIRNGELGLTSHHGVHSNNATNVLFKDLVINEFEVAGIALNGFSGATFKNLDIGPSFHRVPFSGYYSNARYVAQAFRLLLGAIEERDMEMPMVSFSYLDSGKFVTLQQIYRNLMVSMDLAFRSVSNVLNPRDENHPLYESAMRLFLNDPDGHPDGSAVYGIVLHSQSVAVGGFGQHLNEPGHGEDVVMHRVNIHDLTVKVNEVPAVFFDRCDDSNSTDVTILRGPFGDVMDLRKMVPVEDAHIIDHFDVGSKQDLSTLTYAGNVLSDAQIALFLYREYPENGVNYAFRSFIDEHVLKWAVQDYEGSTANPLPECLDFVCNGDIMFHTNKGVFGVRLDLIENVEIQDISISNLTNASPLASCACFNYSGPHDGGTPGTRERQGSMHSDMRGLSVVGGDVLLDGKRNLISGLISEHGDVAGIDLMEQAYFELDVDADLTIDDLQSGSEMDGKVYGKLVSINKTPYPNNFQICDFNVQDESTLLGADDLEYQECRIPDFIKAFTSQPSMDPTMEPTLEPTLQPTLEPTSGIVA